MMRRMGATAGAIVLLCAYSLMIWLFLDDFYPDPAYVSRGYQSILTTRGETFYQKDDEPDSFFYPGGQPLTPEEKILASDALLSKAWYQGFNYAQADHLYGYRWRESWKKIFSSPGIYDPSSGAYILKNRKSDGRACFPLVDEGTYALYSRKGILLGRLGPDGFVDTDVSIKGFQQNAVSTFNDGPRASFIVMDTTGLYQILLDPPAVERLFAAPASTRSSSLLAPSGNQDAGSFMMQWVADTEFFIGFPDSIVRIALPASLQGKGNSFGIVTSASVDRLAINYYENERNRVLIVDMSNGEVSIDTFVPEFTGQVKMYDWSQGQMESERREIFQAAIQPAPIPIVAMTAIAAMLENPSSFKMAPEAVRHAFVLFCSGFIAFLSLHFSGAIAGFLLARCAGLRGHASCFWTLTGFLISFPVILVFPFYVTKKGGIPCPSCGRSLENPGNCSKCGPRSWPGPLIPAGDPKQ